MNRRDAVRSVLALGISPQPVQPAGKAFRIGVLGVHPFPSVPSDPEEQLMFAELARRGYVFGRNLSFISRASGNDLDRLDLLAAELVALKVDLILSTGGTTSALAAKRATSTIPIVMTGSRDPVEDGLVAILSRPGGNVTGNADMGGELMVKRMELLAEALGRRAHSAIWFTNT